MKFVCYLNEGQSWFLAKGRVNQVSRKPTDFIDFDRSLNMDHWCWLEEDGIY